MSTVPVFAPDGTLGDIPAEKLQDAVKAGFKPGVNMVAADGSKGVVPADRYAEATKGGLKVEPFEDQPIKHAGFWHSLASDLGSMVKGVPQVVLQASPVGAAQELLPKPAQDKIGYTPQMERASQALADNQARKDAGRSLPYRMGAPIAEAVGANVRGMEQAAESGDPNAVLGHAAAVPTAMAATAGVSKAAGAVLRRSGPLAERMYQSSLKPSTTLPPAKVAGMVDTGLKNEIPVSPAGVEKIGSLIDDLNDKIKSHIEAGGPGQWPAKAQVKGLLSAAPTETPIPGSSPATSPSSFEPARTTVRDPRTGRMKRMYLSGTNGPIPDTIESPPGVLRRPAQFPNSPAMTPGITIQPGEVVQRLDALKNKFKNQVNPDADLAAIDAAKEEFLKNNPSAIPAAKAQALKTGTYQQLKGRAYGELKSATVESQKALARGLKEELANAFPELKDLNAADSKLIDLEKSITKAVQRNANHQLGGIGTPLAAAGAKAVTGSSAMAAVTGVLKAIVDDPVMKSKLAIAMSKAGKGVTLQTARSRVAAYSAALAASNGAASDRANEQPNGQPDMQGNQ